MLAILRGAQERGDPPSDEDARRLGSADVPLLGEPLDLGEGLDGDAGGDPRTNRGTAKPGKVGGGLDL